MRATGWLPDVPDHRDWSYSDLPGVGRSLFRSVLRPSVVDLSKSASLWPPIFDQESIGSCTAQGWVRVAAYAEAKEGHGPEVLSRLALYWAERKLNGTVYQDSGAQIRDGAKALASYGVGLETLWPYDTTKIYTQPPAPEVREGKHRRGGLQYARLNGKSEILDCLAEGFPVVFGCVLFDAFQDVTATNDVVPLPADGEKPIGGHCMVIVGYDRPKKLFKVANSWGPGWGSDGYCRMPFAYLLDDHLADDFWTLRKIAQ